MISVKCDMCGKDITNDSERNTFRFPHEPSFSSYDICEECSNKIEEFIKTSHECHCEPIKAEAKPCDGKICYKDDEYGCMSCPDFLGNRLTTSKEYIITCTKKHITTSIPLRDIANGINIYPDAFNKED